MNKNKLILPVSIIIGCFILGGFFYLIQLNKQSSIEEQQRLKITYEKEVEDAKLQAQTEIDLAKTELEEKKYLADRKNDCMSIYETENKKWNNVTGWRFDEDKDKCFIEYRENKAKTEEECEEIYPIHGEYSMFWEYLLCADGKFENSF